MSFASRNSSAAADWAAKKKAREERAKALRAERAAKAAARAGGARAPAAPATSSGIHQRAPTFPDSPHHDALVCAAEEAAVSLCVCAALGLLHMYSH